jgi:signal transduction histidine kinase
VAESAPAPRRAAAGASPAAGIGARFVAVAGPTAAAEAAAGPRHPERRSVDRRRRDAALDASLAWSPLLVAATLVALLAGLYSIQATPAGLVWAAAAVLPWIAWVTTLHLLRHRARGIRSWHALQHAFVVLGVWCLLMLAVLPWLPGPPVARGQLTLLLSAAALAAAVTFAPMSPAAAGAALVPLSASLADALQARGPADADQSMPVDLIAGGLCALLALLRHRAWARTVRTLIEREDRIRALEAERDAAVLADQEKSRFLAIASHDLRQPVHALGLFAATLEKRLQGSNEEPLVRNVMHSIDGLDRSFNAMLDISRLDGGSIEPSIQHFPLRDLFRRLHMQFAGQAELAGLNLRFAPGGKSVSSDPQLLERILGNLVQNAIKYTAKGGIVVVARSTSSHVNVEVWDTGVGMQPDDLPRVFEEFYRVGRNGHPRAQGLGMGLAIVKRLALLLGHRLSVASRPGRGTVFRVGIARGGMAEIQDATAAADTLPMPVAQARTVLVVDDDPASCEGLRVYLEEWGYLALIADSQRQAELAVMALTEPPHVIVCDLHLGDGPDGIEVIEHLRRLCGQDVPAILITGDTSNEEMRRATVSGHPVLFKPVQARKLFGALHALTS